MVHQKEDRSYPVLGKKPVEHGLSALGNYVVHRVADHYRIPEERRTGFLSNLAGGIIDTLATSSEKKYKLAITEGFPLPGVLYGFGKGASTASVLYTVTAYGHEFPIHMSRGQTGSKPAEEPSRELLEKNIKQDMIEKLGGVEDLYVVSL